VSLLRVTNNGSGVGVHGNCNSGYGVLGYSSGNGTGVGGVSGSHTGVYGQSVSSYGVYGTSSSFYGVYGKSASTSLAGGVFGENTAHGTSGVLGHTNIGVYGGQGTGSFAGYFSGKVHVNGALSKSSGSFKIDHPLDPANKYLFHSFVESPDMKNVYDGVVVTDENGLAVVELPEWFETLNRDFRYQLTVIADGEEWAQARVAREIKGNTFVIQTSVPTTKVSWQVTGIRQDEWANAHRIPVEELKAPEEQGFYLHPELFGAPEEESIEWARNPEAMKQLGTEREAQQTTAQPGRVR